MKLPSSHRWKYSSSVLNINHFKLDCQFPKVYEKKKKTERHKTLGSLVFQTIQCLFRDTSTEFNIEIWVLICCYLLAIPDFSTEELAMINI